MDSLSYSFKGLAKKAAIRSRAWSDSEKRVSIATEEHGEHAAVAA